jgi:hypothetical protein
MSESDFNRRLKDAVKGVEAPPYLETRIRSHVRETSRGRRTSLRLVPVAIGAAICSSLFLVYYFGGLRWTSDARESYIASVSARVSTLMRVGLGDHVHCAVFHRPKVAPAPEKIEESLGTQYTPLVPVVRRYVPDAYRLVIAHECRYHGRKFVHLAFANDSHLLSLVIAAKQAGESFEEQGTLPALVQSGISMYQAGVQRFAINAFETMDKLVYLVSDLPPSDNSQMMIAMAPPVKRVLETPRQW